MSDIQVSKSILAKLLASENLNISHDASVHTAYFDLNTRTLVCPVWKDMDGALYDLLMGHEVGHALETPKQGWHDALHDGEGNKVSQKFKGFLNVIEDARIEKKIKRKFPGLSKSFATAYKDLYERDFFGVKTIDVNTLNLIDRINLRFKLGAHIPVSFSDAERAIVQEIENVETWDQVVDIAKRVFAMVKEDDSKIQNMSELEQAKQEMLDQEQDEDSGPDDENESDSDSDEESDGDDDTSDYEDIDGSDAQSQQQEESEEEQENKTSKLAGAGDGDEDVDNDDPQSITDRHFRKRENELINQSGKVFMIEMPEANLNKILLSNKIVCDDLEQFIRIEVSRSHTYKTHDVTYDKLSAKCLNKFNKNNKKFISHLAREFDMRKKASQYARQQTARTGELNMNVLHKYKFSNDLFQKITVVPKGKNHGLIMFMDMSGSMQDIMRNTLEQVLVLVSFCKMVGIPYDVYGFSDDFYHSKTENGVLKSDAKKFECNPDVAIMAGAGFHLKHLIGSSLTPMQQRRAFNLLCIVVNEFMRGYSYREEDQDQDYGCFAHNWEGGGFGLNGTPFIQTLLASRELITKFRADHKLDVTNVVYLTDGEGSGAFSFPTIGYHDHHRAVMYFVDKKTKKRVRVEGGHQATVTKLVREATDCKHIGYFLMDRHYSKYLWRELKYRNIDEFQISKLKKDMRENNFVTIPTLGYDKYFYITASTKKITEDEMQITEGMTKSKLANEFSKMVRSKKGNRRLVSNFAEDLAVA